MKVAAVVTDLLLYSRIESAASATGASLVRVDSPDALPPPQELDLVLVDWGGRSSSWADSLTRWGTLAAQSAQPRLVLFGPHTDLEAHADARRHGLGPMLARSKLVDSLGALLSS
jgi:hypothetical protein